MTPTHQATVGSRGDVTAWQFSATANIPIWVARQFHNLGQRNKWQALANGTLLTANEGDWAVRVPDETLSDGKVRVGAIMLFTDKEFKDMFVPLPPPKKAPEVITMADVKRRKK